MGREALNRKKTGKSQIVTEGETTMADEKVNATAAQDQAKTPEAPKQTTPSVVELQAEIEKLKKAISASNADAKKRKDEAAEWQEKYKSTLDEQKRKELEAEETMKRVMAENEQFKAEKRISTYAAKLMGAGFDENTASSMAQSLPDGIPDSFFEQQKAFNEAQKQAIKTSNINAQPNLPVGQSLSSADAMSAAEKNLRKQFGL